MSIEIPSKQIINLPSDNTEKLLNSPNILKDSADTIEPLDPTKNFILNLYSSEKVHNQGNSISAQILESVSDIDSSYRDSRQKWLNSSTTLERPSIKKYQRIEPNHTNILNDSQQKSIEDIKQMYKTSRKFQTSMLTINFVSSYLSAFQNTLNKFLRM